MIRASSCTAVACAFAIAVLGILATATWSPRAAAQEYWTVPFSEESGSHFCEAGFLAAGLSCQGHYCDNMEMLCRRFPFEQAGPYGWRWYPAISEEAPNNRLEGGDAIVQAMKCEGRYCDNVIMRRFEFRDYRVQGCRLVGPLSDVGADISLPSSASGRNEARCPPGYWLNGMRCEGRYCDNVTLNCCRFSR